MGKVKLSNNEMYTLKIIFIKIICITGIILCLPIILSEKSISHFPNIIKNQKYNLGIDLQGGSQITLEIDFKENVKESTKILSRTCKDLFKKHKISYYNLKLQKNKIYFYVNNQ